MNAKQPTPAPIKSQAANSQDSRPLTPPPPPPPKGLKYLQPYQGHEPQTAETEAKRWDAILEAESRLREALDSLDEKKEQIRSQILKSVRPEMSRLLHRAFFNGVMFGAFSVVVLHYLIRWLWFS